MDIELALIELSKNNESNLINSLPNGYDSEDRSNKGWGLVIRASGNIDGENIDDCIKSFLEGLVDVKEIIFQSEPILRLAIYNKNINYTLTLKSFKILSDFNITLEASIYPED